MTFLAAWERGRPGAQQGQLRLLGSGTASPVHVPGALGAFASQPRGADHSAFCGGRPEFVLSLRTTGVITSLVLECENPDRADGPVEPEVPRGEEEGDLAIFLQSPTVRFHSKPELQVAAETSARGPAGTWGWPCASACHGLRAGGRVR